MGDHYNKKQPICPHCDAEYDIDKNESYFLYNYDEENHELICDGCEKEFWVKPVITFTFTSAECEDELF